MYYIAGTVFSSPRRAKLQRPPSWLVSIDPYCTLVQCTIGLRALTTILRRRDLVIGLPVEYAWF